MGRGEATKAQPGVQRRRRWSDELIRTTMAGIVGDRKTLPTRRELDALGQRGLFNAMDRRGGVRRWAREFGLELGRGQDRSFYGDDDALADVREVLRDAGYVPGAQGLRKMGYPRLATYLDRTGGSKEFQIRHRRELFR